MVAALYILSFALIGLLGTTETIQQTLEYARAYFADEIVELLLLLLWLALTEVTVRLITVFIPRIRRDAQFSGRMMLAAMSFGWYGDELLGLLLPHQWTEFMLIIKLVIIVTVFFIYAQTDWLDIVFNPRVFRLLEQVEEMIESREFERAYTTLTKTKLSDSPWHWAELGSLYGNEEWEGYDPHKATEAFRRSYDAYDPIGSARLGARIADQRLGVS